MKKMSRSIMTAALAIGIGTSAYIAYELFETQSTPPGFCKAKHRVLSDKEFIAIAISARDARTRSLPEHGIKSDFDSGNPNCCRVYKDESSQRFRDEKKLYRYDEMVVVDLNNETSRTDRSPLYLAATDTIVMTPCGVVTDVNVASPASFNSR